ncbi:34689_t:CDS:1 [Gigaspora margarita]|uniref:34689_t:CDS:1 n=1 Tax=Gigaspora margarita TaxID=4874 RepID=A0ABN7UJ36_GIGMA|nr:34689_t:CDS:1 [Gigaspora margarita]
MQMQKIKILQIEINRLINKSSKEYETQKKYLDFLFKQLQKVQCLREYCTNPQLLNAFLLLQGFHYHTEFDKDKILERISEEVEQLRKKLEPEDKTLASYSFTELEQELERRINLEEKAQEKILKD